MQLNQEEEDAVMDAAYNFVSSMVPRADDTQNLLWHGWALREAFIAGIKWWKEQNNAA